MESQQSLAYVGLWAGLESDAVGWRWKSISENCLGVLSAASQGIQSVFPNCL